MPSTTAINDFLDPPKREGEIGRLGPYRVLQQIGKGGMGHVFRARDARLKREVALKVMNEKIAATANSRKRFVEEARSMAAVHHDNVATIFEVGMHRGMPFIAMEMLQGSPLNKLQRGRQRFEPDEVIRLAREVATGLAAAHQRGIIHRDIKPGNLWIEAPSGRAKILDFGLAIANAALDGFSPRGAAVGSPGYLAPEQARNDPVDDRTDLYSLGVVMYQLCSGRLPIAKDSIIGQMIANICVVPPPLKERSPETPQPLCELIDRMLDKEPRNRPRSATHLMQLLDDVQRRCDAENEINLQIVTDAPARPSRQRRDDVNASAESDTSTQTKAVASPRDDSDNEPGRGLPIWIWPAAAAAILIVAIGIYVAVPGEETAPSQATTTSTTSTVPFRVNPESLRPLVLSEISGTQQVTSGQAARFELQLENQSQGGSGDPRRKNAQAPIAAQIVTLLQPVGRTQTQQPAFPRKLPPAQLPRPKQSRTFDIHFLTTGVLAGQYDVIFELQAPGGQSISRIQRSLDVIEKPPEPKDNAAERGGNANGNGKARGPKRPSGNGNPP